MKKGRFLNDFEEPPRLLGINPALQKISQLSQRGKIGIADDDMVEHFDFKELSGTDKIAGDFDVSLRRRRLSAWMIVHEDDCGRCGNNRCSKDFAWMNHQCVNCTN